MQFKLLKFNKLFFIIKQFVIIYRNNHKYFSIKKKKEKNNNKQGRKLKSNNEKGKYNKNSSDNIVKKIKGILLSNLIAFINKLIQKYKKVLKCNFKLQYMIFFIHLLTKTCNKMLKKINTTNFLDNSKGNDDETLKMHEITNQE